MKIINNDLMNYKFIKSLFIIYYISRIYYLIFEPVLVTPYYSQPSEQLPPMTIKTSAST